MSCIDAFDLMDEALDGSRPPELAVHLATCHSCADQWAQLVALEDMLRRPEQPRLPRGFHRRTMERLDMSLSSPWLAQSDVRAVLSAATLLTGVLLVSVGIAAVLQAIRQPEDVAGWLDVARALGGWGLDAAGFMVTPASANAITWSVYGILALALALLWFGALLMPRHLPRGWAPR